MANLLAQNPIYIDTAFQSYKSAVATVLGTLLQLRIYSIRWVGASAGQILEFVNPNSGLQLHMMECDVTGKDQVSDFSAAPRLWADFGVPAVPSGKVFIDARM